MALDTGATSTLINVASLVSAGYDPLASSKHIQITTGSGIEYAAVIRVSAIQMLGKRAKNFPLLAHSLPPSAGVDGLIGLDFLRGEKLTIDCVSGTIGLSPRRAK
jgi:predicted aspartyl protease